MRLERGIASLGRADDDSVWDAATFSGVEDLLARLTEVVARQRARRSPGAPPG